MREANMERAERKKYKKGKDTYDKSTFPILMEI